MPGLAVHECPLPGLVHDMQQASCFEGMTARLSEIMQNILLRGPPIQKGSVERAHALDSPDGSSASALHLLCNCS